MPGNAAVSLPGDCTTPVSSFGAGSSPPVTHKCDSEPIQKCDCCRSDVEHNSADAQFFYSKRHEAKS